MSLQPNSSDYVVSKVTPTIHTRLGYKMFLMFACLNVGAMAPFALYVHPPLLIMKLVIVVTQYDPRNERTLPRRDGYYIWGR